MLLLEEEVGEGSVEAFDPVEIEDALLKGRCAPKVSDGMGAEMGLFGLKGKREEVLGIGPYPVRQFLRDAVVDQAKDPPIPAGFVKGL